jgi:hypothetical protein
LILCHLAGLILLQSDFQSWDIIPTQVPKWKTFKRSVPREKLSKVRIAIDANQPVSEILKIIG